ncbi:ATPase, T2SS/T4P/T4SS family [Fusobacterium ulcerans]|uniref:ATPase, T2SS/T4P/T4SS family n=1 Tax=Fusobacterium ulcerans TaxID=861 RepID=UPI001D0BCBEA|nr:ATPase, T2SS/T4P/T4SS family [Fusobacterium ulcerans]MCB8564484.1 Flp pilus assembly complex ATPase component TadA [Fusobacterium ulcerans]MCB8648655.1 Flp pilus assembly complex ATPase component TadA [Fusobacterium ulcerans]
MESNNILEAKAILEHGLEKLGILEYLKDDTVTEIMVNPDNKIYIKVLGQGKIFTGKISDPGIARNIINTLAALDGIVVNELNPGISTNLPLTNSRFEAMVPIIVENPCFTIRKKILKVLKLDDYVKQGAFTEKEKDLIVSYVKNKRNILIVGGTDTGKTTFANAVIDNMQNERLYFIEEVRELQSTNDDNTFVLTIQGIYSPQQALKRAMRWSPDRIIMGEVRGAEAFDLLNAFNSGHEGGLCTIHANDCYGGLSKLETYILYEKSNPLSDLIARVINVVITMKIEDNKRVLDSIAEVKDYVNGKYILDFKFKRGG